MAKQVQTMVWEQRKMNDDTSTERKGDKRARAMGDEQRRDAEAADAPPLPPPANHPPWLSNSAKKDNAVASRTARDDGQLAGLAACSMEGCTISLRRRPYVRGLRVAVERDTIRRDRQ